MPQTSQGKPPTPVPECGVAGSSQNVTAPASQVGRCSNVNDAKRIGNDSLPDIVRATGGAPHDMVATTPKNDRHPLWAIEPHAIVPHKKTDTQPQTTQTLHAAAQLNKT